MPKKAMPKKAKDKSRTKNPAAVALGRLGGKAPRNGKRGFAAMPTRRVRQIARQGVRARWDRDQDPDLQRAS